MCVDFKTQTCIDSMKDTSILTFHEELLHKYNELKLSQIRQKYVYFETKWAIKINHT